MTDVLITGGSGFVGSNLTRKLLDQGHSVSLFLRRESNLWRIQNILDKLEIYYIDNPDITKIKKYVNQIKPEKIFHLATYGGYPFQQDISSIIQNNIFYSVNLMQSLVNLKGLKMFVNVGSSSEYGLKNRPMSESDSCVPFTPYGISKNAQTLFAKFFSDQEKLPSITLRLFSVYGPYEEPGRLITDIMESIIRKQKLKLFSPLPRRDFIFVDDVVNAFIKAAESEGVNGEIINIGSGYESSVRDIINIIKETINEKNNFSWGDNQKQRNFDKNTRWVANITKAKNLLDWKPDTSLKVGLTKTYNWFKKNIELYNNARR